MKPIFYLSILLSSMLLTSCYRKFDLEEYRTTPKMVINSAFSPDTVVMASISRTWFQTFEEPRIPYRETITKKARADYRHKKQSGYIEL